MSFYNKQFQPSFQMDLFIKHAGAKQTYHLIPNISRTFVCHELVDHSDVVEASVVGAAATTRA